MFFRRLIRSHPLLYPFYIRWIVRNKTVVFPPVHTDLHLTGFPRSANTYCMNIVNEAFPGLSISTQHPRCAYAMELFHSLNVGR